MRKPQVHGLCLVILVAAYILYPFALNAADEPNLTKDQIKQFLTNAKVVKSHWAKKGITNTKRLTLSDGTITHDASFQTEDEHKNKEELSDGRVEIGFVDSYKYNIAAYMLAELIGFDDMMPVYVERRWDGQIGSLSWWVDVMMDEVERVKQKKEPPDRDAWNNQMYKIRVFDQLVYDTDPNLTNVLIGPDWKLWRIDFSRAFRTHHELTAPKDLVRCDRHMFEQLKALNADEFREKAKHYLTKEEIKAVIVRRDQIVQLFDKQIAEKGENAVLY